MDMSEIKKKTDAELKAMLVEKHSALRAFRFSIAGSQIREVRQGRVLRRDIARIETELSARHES